MLSGKPATTHWNYFEQFSRRYPEVELKTRHLITQSDNIYCVGSVNSIADLMVHIVQEWFGSRIARAIENQFSPEIRQTFGAAAYQNEADSSHHDEVVLEAQQWLQEHLPSPHLHGAAGRTSETYPPHPEPPFQTGHGHEPTGLFAKPAHRGCQRSVAPQ